MSKGYGKTQQGILSILADNVDKTWQPAYKGNFSKLPSKGWVAIYTLAQLTYNTTQPTNSQRASIARSIKRLWQDGVIEYRYFRAPTMGNRDQWRPFVRLSVNLVSVWNKVNT